LIDGCQTFIDILDLSIRIVRGLKTSIDIERLYDMVPNKDSLSRTALALMHSIVGESRRLDLYAKALTQPPWPAVRTWDHRLDAVKLPYFRIHRFSQRNGCRCNNHTSTDSYCEAAIAYIRARRTAYIRRPTSNESLSAVNHTLGFLWSGPRPIERPVLSPVPAGSGPWSRILGDRTSGLAFGPAD
jgi:hypothetical protein